MSTEDLAADLVAFDRTEIAARQEQLTRARGELKAHFVGIDAIIDEYELPAHTVGLGVKGCVTWSTTPTTQDWNRIER